MDGDKSSKSEMILVRSRNTTLLYVDDTPGSERKYSKMEFHLIDLKKGTITPNFLPSMLNCNGRGVSLRLGSNLYIVGGLSSSLFDMIDDDQGKYRGASRFDLTRIKDSTWTHAPLPIANPGNANRTSLCGKIYGFGMAQPRVEVFDPNFDQWKLLAPLPSEYNGYCVAGVLPDPKNRRFIVSLVERGDCSWPLCAFYPDDDDDDDGRWVCLHRNFVRWSNMAALVDGVVYLYQIERYAQLWAFELETAKSVDIVWTSLLPAAGKKLYWFDALFPLSTKDDGVLCFASSLCNYDVKAQRTESSTVTLIKFRVERSGGGSTVLCTPLGVQAHVLPYTKNVYDFLPLDDEVFA